MPELLQASYRGVPFSVEEHDLEVGRVGEIHTYPFRDRPYVVDHGRKPRRYRMRGFVLGDDHLEQAKRLTAAIERRSTSFPYRSGGLLVHPWIGAVDVFCTTAVWRDSNDESRKTTFVLEFIESGDEPRPGAVADHLGAADDAAASASSAASAQLEEGLAVSGVPERVRETTAASLRSFSQRLGELDVFTGPAEAVNSLGRELARVLADASTLATSPADAARSVVGSLDLVFDAAANALGALSAYEALVDFPPTITGGESPENRAQDENSRLVSRLVRVAALGGAVRSAARVEWSSRDEAVEVAERIAAEVDEVELEGLDGPELEDAVADLRAALAGAVPPPGADLPELHRITLPSTLPALVLAYRLYEDAEREAEIVERNAIRHPLFVPAGVELEVLDR